MRLLHNEIPFELHVIVTVVAVVATQSHLEYVFFPVFCTANAVVQPSKVVKFAHLCPIHNVSRKQGLFHYFKVCSFSLVYVFQQKIPQKCCPIDTVCYFKNALSQNHCIDEQFSIIF